MEREKEEVNNNPFDVDLSLLQEMGNLIPDIEEEVLINNEKELGNDNVASEVTEEVSVQVEDKTGVPSSQDVKDTSLFTPYAKLLVEEGVTPNLDLTKYDGTVEGLLKAVNDEIDYGINKYKENNLHPRLKWLQDNLDEGVPIQQLLAIDEERVTLNNITPEVLESDESLQKNILKQYFKETTKFDDGTIDKQIERIEATGDLGEESKKFFDELKKLNAEKERLALVETQKQRELLIKQEQELLTTFKNTLDKTEEVVSGIKVTPIMKDKIYKTLTTIVDYEQGTNVPLNRIAKARVEDPIGFEIKLGYIFEATNGFKDWSVFQGAGKKAAIKDFEESVRKLDIVGHTTQTNNNNSVDKSLIADMEQIARMGRGW